MAILFATKPVRYIPLFFTIPALLILCSIALTAQQETGLHPFIGYRYDALPVLNRISGPVSTFSAQGTAGNHTGTAGMEFPAPIPALASLRGRFRFGLEVSSGYFASDPYPSLIIDPETELPVTSINTSSVDVSSLAFRLDLRLTAYANDDITIFSGLWTSWLFSTDAVLREQLVSPDGPVFATSGTRERLVPTGPDLFGRSIRYGPLAGLAWSLHPSAGLAIIPELSFSFDAGAASIARGLGAGLGVSFSYTSVRAVPEEPARPTPPVVAVDLFATDTTGLRSDTARIGLRSVLHRRYFSLPPFLVPGSDNHIAGRYRHMTAAEADTFSIEAHPDISLPDFYHHTISIIGQRLRATPEAILSLSVPSGNKRLRQYAEAVRSYFATVWRLDSTRLHLVYRPAVQAAADTVIMLDASSPVVLAPVVVQWIEEKVAVPMIGMEKQVGTATGTGHWRAIVRQDDTHIAAFSSQDKDSVRSISSIPVYGLHTDSLSAPLIAELTVTDSAGYAATGCDTLPLVVTATGSGEQHTYCFMAPVPGVKRIETVNSALLSHLLEYTDSTSVIRIDFPSREADWSMTFAGEHFLSLLNTRGIRPAGITISPSSAVHSVPAGGPPLPALRIIVERPPR